MNLKELKQKLLMENIPSNSFSFDFEYPNEAFCLRKNSGGWEVYYSERGQKSNLKQFQSEVEACEYFYISLTNCLRNMRLI